MKRLFYRSLTYIVLIPLIITNFFILTIYKLNINKQINDLEISMDSYPLNEMAKITLYEINKKNI